MSSFRNVIYLKCLFVLFIDSVSMDTFPKNFKFGVATASYQVEGAWNVDGKTENIWDYQSHTFPEKILDRSNGDIACDSYNKIDEDIKNLKQLKVNFYRFSLSWCRILPTGFPNEINEAGVKYYKELIDKLLENGIEPMVTLFHWDLPQKLQELGGWANIKMAEYFADYARVCFKLFGDRVKTWITINEPTQICHFGYGTAQLAPFYDSDGIGSYLCGHVLIIAHAKAYHVYNKEFKSKQKGRVGITIELGWFEPRTRSPDDIDAANTKMQMYNGWFLHPICSKEGDYPKKMRDRADMMSAQQGFPRSRLPYFTTEEISMIRGTHDFLGVNHYVTYLCEPDKNCDHKKPSFQCDTGVKITLDDNWTRTARDAFRVVPWGIKKLLIWIKETYGNPEVIITESGYAGFQNDTVVDTERTKYLNSYLKEILEAVKVYGCHVTGYTFWSYMDNYEWADGYTMKFGLYDVDFNAPTRTRTPKQSAFVYQNIIVTRTIQEDLFPTKFLH